jgi:WYL domain
VILRAPVAAVAPRVPHAYGTLEPIDEHSCLLLTGAEWLDGLAIYIANIGVEFEIVEPPELVGRVRELAERFERATR